ncbi:MAG: sugar nucleotide-binding protein [bacterium]|nr:sugar nucleotide-binding protein [bacterium]
MNTSPAIAVLATGLNGLVGSRIHRDYSDQYSFTNLDISDPVNPTDITNLDQVKRVFATSEAEFVIHLAAFTDVTAAWQQQGDKDGVAYRVNVIGTENIVKAASEYHKHLIHISTAYVFDGKKEASYLEADETSPIEWYGETKARAESIIQASNSAWTVLRIDQPFRSDPFPKLDVAHKIIEGIKANTLYPQFTDHYFGPTFINDFSRVIEWVLRTKTKGLYHASSGERWTDFDFASSINTQLGLGGSVKGSSINEYLKTATRPYQLNTALNSDKLQAQLDFSLSSVADAISKIEVTTP